METQGLHVGRGEGQVGASSVAGDTLLGWGAPKTKIPASRGVKLLLITLLALGMSLLALFVDGLSSDRRDRAEKAEHAVSAGVVGRYVALVPAYRSVERSLKYAPLFLGLVFLSYFLFEVRSGRPMHLAQYVLVGVAQLIFYLLLLSFAERVGFDWGFLLGSGATVTLLSVNAGWVFRDVRQRWRAMGVFGALYLLIYCLLRMENNALLIGSVASFAAVAAAMYWTRGLDWYGDGVLSAGPEVR